MINLWIKAASINLMLYLQTSANIYEYHVDTHQMFIAFGITRSTGKMWLLIEWLLLLFSLCWCAKFSESK